MLAKSSRPQMLSGLGFILTLMISGAMFFLIEQNNATERRQGVREIGSSYAHSIEQQVDSSLTSTLALAAIVKQNNGEIEDFDALAHDITEIYEISNLQLAPDAVVSYIYPLEGNEAALGHDLLNDPNRRTETLKTIESRELTLAGPFALVQGGVAIIGRYPVFITDETTTDEEFWGLTIVLINLDDLIENSEIQQLVASGYDFQLSRINPTSNQKEIFAQSDEKLFHNPVTISVEVPNGTWDLAIVPQDGRPAPQHYVAEFIFTLGLGILVAILIYRWSANDLRTQKKIKSALDINKHNLDRVEHVARLGSYEWDAQTDIFHWSDGTFRIYDYDPDIKPSIKLVKKRIHPDDREIFNTALRNALTNQDGDSENNSTIYRIITRAGDIRYVMARNECIYDKSGEILLMRGTVQDITTLAQTEKALRESENRYRMITELMSDFAFSISIAEDGSQHFDWLTDSVSRVLGYDVEELMGTQQNVIQATAHPDDFAKIQEAIEETLRGHNTETELRAITRDGNEVWLRIVRLPVMEQGTDRVIGLYGAATDITAAKTTERIRGEKESLEMALTKEKEIADLKNRYMSMLAHEFRTPLTIISTSVSLLEKYWSQLTDEKRWREFNKVFTSIQHLDNMLGNLSIFARSERGYIEFQPMQTEVVSFCREIIEDVQRTLGVNHNLIFVCKLRSETHSLDQVLLRHIFINLLSNAVKYSAPKSVIKFSLSVNDQYLIFQIQDEGIGISADDKLKLFDAFHRGQNVGTRKGTGIGLSIVKDAVDIHGGAIEITSEIDHGTSVIVRIPISKTQKS